MIVVYLLLGIIIFLLFVWDLLLFSHERRILKKLDEILREIKDEKGEVNATRRKIHEKNQGY